jgi:hypothetical protein
MASTWNIRLEQLRVNDADEDGVFSDGDEPYLVAIGFRSRFRTAGSTQVFWGEMLDDDWANGVESGDTRAIPGPMGTLEFPAVDLPTLDQIVHGTFPEVLGSLVIAMESDATPFDAVRDKVHDIEGVIRSQLTNLVEGGALDLQNPGPQIKAAVKAAQDQLTPSIGEAIGLWLQSFGDPDDLVGVNVLAYAAVDQSVDVQGVAKLAEQGVALDFNADGVSYSVSGRVTREGWKGFGLAAAGSAATTSPVAAVSRIPGSMELWYVAPNGSVQDKFWYDGTNWNGFELAPAGSASPAGGIAAVSRIPGSMEVWWIGQDGSVQGAYWYDGANWGRYELAPAGSASPAGGIAALSRIPGSMEVWFVGPDGSLQDKYWYDGGNWGGFQIAPAGSASTTGGIAAVCRIPTSMELWHPSPDGGVQDHFVYL